MSYIRRKKAELLFVKDNECGNTISLAGDKNPIAVRTRSRTKCASESKLKDKTTPTLSKLTRYTNAPNSTFVVTPKKTPSPKRTRSLTKQSSKDIGLPFVSKVFKPGCSSKEGKVTPLKINTSSLSRNQTPSDDSSDEKTPIVVSNRTPSTKYLQSSEDVFRSSSRKRNASQKRKEATPSVNNCHTPKTPRLRNDSSTTTPSRTGSANRTMRNLSCTPGTPKFRRALRFDKNNLVPSTPISTRSRLKKEIQNQKNIKENISEEDDFENEDSEYSAGDSDLGEIESDSDYEQTPIKRNRLSTIQHNLISSPLVSYRITPQKTIVHKKMVILDSEKYFEKKSSKSVSSSNILSKLPLPEISEFGLGEVDLKSYAKHRNEMKRLMTKYQEQFNTWLLYLKEGFNLMLYGLGSKLEILKQFYNEKLDTSCVIRVNGFNSNFSINEMIRSLIQEISQISRSPANINEALDLIAKELIQSKLHVFLIINNIDGVALRGNKKQTMLSKLAELSNIHIIATLDHINAPLLWGNNKMSSFNFIWLDTTTFSSYATEISYQKSIGIDNLGSDSSLSTLNQLFKWQDQRTKEVFELIVKEFLDNKNKKNFKGMLTTDLSRSALKNLSISTNSALNSTLKHFIDHEIICIEHNYLKFLINPSILRTFYNQHFSK